VRHQDVDRRHDEERDDDAEVDDVPAGQHERGRLHLRRQLEVGDDRAGEGHRTDEDADEDLGVVDARVGPTSRRRSSTRRARPRDRRSCAASRSARACRSSRPCGPCQMPMTAPMAMAPRSAAEPVDALPASKPPTSSSRQTAATSDDERDRHADDAVACCPWPVSCLDSPASARMNSSAGDDVGALDQGLGDHRVASSRLNIFSIRAVTVKPPKTLMLATRIR
jgi:hypothetical protein